MLQIVFPEPLSFFLSIFEIICPSTILFPALVESLGKLTMSIILNAAIALVLYLIWEIRERMVQSSQEYRLPTLACAPQYYCPRRLKIGMHEKRKSFLTLIEIEDTFYFIFHKFLLRAVFEWKTKSESKTFWTACDIHETFKLRQSPF